MIKKLYIVALAAICLAGCARSEVTRSTPSGTPSNVPTPQLSAAIRPGVVVKAGGWQIPGLDGSTVGERKEVKSGSAVKMHVTRFSPPTSKGQPYVMDDSFFTPDEQKSLGVLGVFTGDLVVSDIWAYDIEGRIFSYLVLVHPPRIGMMIYLRFYDDDGDGKFESVERGKGVIPNLPRWAQSNNSFNRSAR